jgi:hypothetical protein
MKTIQLFLIFKSVKPIILLMSLFFSTYLLAQKDAIIKKDSAEIRCKILKENQTKYTYATLSSKNKVTKVNVLKSIVQRIEYDKYDSNLLEHKLFEAKPIIIEAGQEPQKAYTFSFAIGLNIGNVLEYNAPSGPDKKSFSGTSAIDIGLDYYKETSRFAMTNELHWNLAVQKSGLTGADRIQRANDELATLHDFSFTLSKSSKWNANLIVKSNTSIFTIYDGDYFKDYNQNGKTQGFANPYEVVFSPGIKYQPNDYFRVSLSPYSVSLYGLTNQEIANTGFYTQTYDENDNYDLFEFKELGADLNIWYDRKYKKWLEMQYRMSISSDYFSETTKNGLMDGLFITKFKIIKNISLAHRATLKGDLFQVPFKPNYKQTILLSFSKSF